MSAMSAAVAVKTPAGMDQVRKACAFIQQHADASITLARLARHVNASPFHFQRVFTRIVGISPRAYQDALRAGTLQAGPARGRAGDRRDLRRRVRVEQSRLRTAADRTRDDASGVQARRAGRRA